MQAGVIGFQKDYSWVLLTFILNKALLMLLASMKLSQYYQFHKNIKISSIHLKNRLTDKSYTKPCKKPKWCPFDIFCIIKAMVVKNLKLHFVSIFSLQKICTLLKYNFNIILSNYEQFFQDDQWCITNCKLSFLLRK